MEAEAIASVGAAVTIAVELAKWARLPRDYAPAAILVFAAIGVGLWTWSAGVFSRETAFEIFAGWLTVSMGAAGVFGFVRGSRHSVAEWRKPSTDTETANGGRP